MELPNTICACVGYCRVCLAQMIARICVADVDQFHPAAWERKDDILEELDHLSRLPYDPDNLAFLEFVRRVCYASRQ